MIHFIALKLLCLTPLVVSPTDSTEAIVQKFNASPHCVVIEITMPFDTAVESGSNGETTQLEFWYKDAKYYSFVPVQIANKILSALSREA